MVLFKIVIIPFCSSYNNDRIILNWTKSLKNDFFVQGIFISKFCTALIIDFRECQNFNTLPAINFCRNGTIIILTALESSVNNFSCLGDVNFKRCTLWVIDFCQNSTIIILTNNFSLFRWNECKICTSYWYSISVKMVRVSF